MTNYGSLDNVGMYLNRILELSSKDHRLAIVAQSSYYSRGEILLANKFSHLTKEEYVTYEDFLESDNKYVYQFKNKSERKQRSKNHIINLILSKLEQEGITRYRLAKINDIPRNKLYAILNKKDMNAYSLKRLNQFYMSIPSK